MEIATSQDETRKQVDLIANHMLEMQTRQSSIQEKLQSLQMVSTASDPHQQKPALQSIVHIPVAIHRQQPCRMFCMCRCHQKTTLATRAWMQQLVGTLFIGYNAFPSLSFVTCNERMCGQRQSQLINVSYYFPFWLLKRALFLRGHYSPTDGCMISVRTPRLVSPTSPQILILQ